MIVAPKITAARPGAEADRIRLTDHCGGTFRIGYGGLDLRTLACLVVLAAVSSLQTSTSAGQNNTRPGTNGGQRIAGRVTDRAGRGVGGVFVSVLRDADEPGAPRLHPVDVRLYALTNDHGDFAIDNLAPDNYCLVALPHNRASDAQGRPNHDGYAITYYPNVTRAADARSVMVGRSAGATANIVLAPARLSVVSGAVTASSGRPASGETLRISHGDGLFGLDGTSTTLRSDGSFALSGMPPGTYFLHMREGVWPPPRDVIPRVSVATVIVADRDVPDVRVQPFPMVRATGRVVIDPALRSSLPHDIRIGSRPFDIQGNPGPDRPGIVRSDLTFELHAWPRPAEIVIASRSEWSVARVRVNGVDVTRTGIDFRAGHDVTGLEIELTRAPPR